MNTAKVVPAHVERNRGFMVRQLLAVRQSQTAEPFQLHSYGQVLALNVRSRDFAFIGVSANDIWERLQNLGRGKPIRAGKIRGFVHFYQLGKVNVRAKVL